VSALPQGAGGFRGALLLRAGYYPIAGPLRVQASGVVLRGEGMEDAGTVLIGTRTAEPAEGSVGARGGPGGGPPGQTSLIQIGGASAPTLQEATRQTIVDDYVPVGARAFRVASAGAFRPGDTVIVRRVGNQAWIDEVGMAGE